MYKPKLKNKFFLTWNKKKLYFLKKNLRKKFYKNANKYKLKINFYFYPIFNKLWSKFEKRVDIISFRLNNLINLTQAKSLIKYKSHFYYKKRIIKSYSKYIKYNNFFLAKKLKYKKIFFSKFYFTKYKKNILAKKKFFKPKLGFLPNHLLHFYKYNLTLFIPSINKNYIPSLTKVKKFKLFNLSFLQKKFKKNCIIKKFFYEKIFLQNKLKLIILQKIINHTITIKLFNKLINKLFLNIKITYYIKVFIFNIIFSLLKILLHNILFLIKKFIYYYKLKLDNFFNSNSIKEIQNLLRFKLFNFLFDINTLSSYKFSFLFLNSKNKLKNKIKLNKFIKSNFKYFFNFKFLFFKKYLVKNKLLHNNLFFTKYFLKSIKI